MYPHQAVYVENLTFVSQPIDCGCNASRPDFRRALSANDLRRRSRLLKRPQAGWTMTNTILKSRKPHRSGSAPNALQPSRLFPRRPVQPLVVRVAAAGPRRSLSPTSRAVAAVRAPRKCRRTRNSTCRQRSSPSFSARPPRTPLQAGRRDPQGRPHEHTLMPKARARHGPCARRGKRLLWVRGRARGSVVGGMRTATRSGSRYLKIGCTIHPSLRRHGLHAVARAKGKPRQRYHQSQKTIVPRSRKQTW